jgi:hypothetical protein
MSYTVPSLLTELSSTDDPAEFVSSQLSSFPPEQQLHILTSFLLDAASKAENTCHIIAAAWDYLASKPELWQHDYSTLEGLKSAVNFDDTLKNLIGISQDCSSRVQIALTTVTKKWKVTYPTMFKQHDPPIPVPFLPSDHFARELARLSKVSQLKEALHLLYKQMNPGKTRRKTLKARILGLGDIKTVADSLCKATFSPIAIKKPAQFKRKSFGAGSNLSPSTSSNRCNCSPKFESRNPSIQKLSISESFKYFVKHYDISLKLCWNCLRKYITSLK